MSNSGSGATSHAEPLPPPQPVPEVHAELEDDELTCERNLALLSEPPVGAFSLRPTHVKVFYSRSAVDEDWYWDRADVAQETHDARAAVTYLRRDAPPWLADLADTWAPPK